MKATRPEAPERIVAPEGLAAEEGRIPELAELGFEGVRTEVQAAGERCGLETLERFLARRAVNLPGRHEHSRGRLGGVHADQPLPRLGQSGRARRGAPRP